MGPFWRLFDPLWGLIGRNPWASAVVLALAMLAAFMVGQRFAAMLLGGALGTVLMIHAESVQASGRADGPALPPSGV